MNRIKVLVVEDEVIIADNICRTLEGFDYEALEPALTYSEALERIDSDQPDIAILDSKLAGKESGIDLANKINNEYDFPFLFLTSNSDKVTFEKAKFTEPHAFLVKPFGKDELFAALELALLSYAKKSSDEIQQRTAAITDALFVKQKSHFVRVNFEEILYIQSDGVYLDIHTVNSKSLTVRGSLNDYISKLDSNFMRSHRSYIINLAHLDSISQNSAFVGGVEISIGKKYRPFFLSRLIIG